MRLLEKEKDWETHQRSEIRRFLRLTLPELEIAQTDRLPECVPLYPGSMLFNQIAVLHSRPASNEAVSDEAVSELVCQQVPLFESLDACLLYTSPSPRDGLLTRMPSSA